MTAHVQRRNGERPHFFPDLMGVQGMYLVRLLKIRRHLGKNLPVGDPDIDSKAKEYIIEKGYDEKYGARPLRRAIQRYIEDELSDMLLRGELKNGQTIFVNLVDNKLDFMVK